MRGAGPHCSADRLLGSLAQVDVGVVADPTAMQLAMPSLGDP